ncbi:putative protein [Arabidopsis thaliana]|nr:putative protein [Arabidopsis thaliana]
MLLSVGSSYRKLEGLAINPTSKVLFLCEPNRSLLGSSVGVGWNTEHLELGKEVSTEDSSSVSVDHYESHAGFWQGQETEEVNQANILSDLEEEGIVPNISGKKVLSLTRSNISTALLVYRRNEDGMGALEFAHENFIGKIMLPTDEAVAGLKPSGEEHERLIWACTREEHYIVSKELRNGGSALEMYEDLLDEGPEPNNLSYELVVSYFNILLSAAGRRGIWRWEPMRLQLRPKSIKQWLTTVKSHGALLSALEKGKLYDEVLRVWNHMVKVGIEPNLYAYTTMASVLTGQQKLNLLDTLLKEMPSKGIIKPSVVTYNAVISGCTRNGLSGVAYEWFHRMRIERIYSIFADHSEAQNIKTETLNMFLWLVIVLTISASVSSYEHKLNWVVPPANSSESFNDWASNKRFQVGDIIQFKYKKDSVMQVTKESYKQCNSSHPRFYSNTGKTRFMFDHSVPYYFISGTSGHCEKGQKMIVEPLFIFCSLVSRGA